MLAATRPPRPSDDPSIHASEHLDTSTGLHSDGLAPAFLHLLRDVPYVRSDFDEQRESSCQKMLFSATLTRDPAKIAALGLRQPKYIVVQNPKPKEEGVLDFVMEKFTMPATLTVRLALLSPFSLSSFSSLLFSLRLHVLTTRADDHHSWLWRVGTHDRMRTRSEAANALLPRARAGRHERARVHQVRRVRCPARTPRRVLRGCVPTV